MPFLFMTEKLFQCTVKAEVGGLGGYVGSFYSPMPTNQPFCSGKGSWTSQTASQMKN